MSWATDSDLTTRAPPAAAVDVGLRAVALADAALLLDEAAIGDTLVPAHAYLAAHLLASTPGSGMPAGVGHTTSAKAGEIAATYTAAAIASDLDSSHWGRLHKMFMPIHTGVTG